MPDTGITGVILAGGKSRRMGMEKSLAILEGRPLVEHVGTRLRPQVSRLVLNANGVASRFGNWDLPMVTDDALGDRGPLAGVLAGLAWARGSAPGGQAIVTTPADTPFIPRDLVTRLAAGWDGEGIIIAASRGRVHPVVAMWPMSVEADLRRDLAKGALSVGGWALSRRHEVVEFADVAGIDPFFNINSPADLLSATVASAYISVAEHSGNS
ncbi:molybdenum cofactor guanylyltransferase [Agaricicola taiwanensis]|uniref:Molybdenum cofactor guanylyltransferase n=1 Tax=Agaricicola taiwanensis TaxID=591372 RepID=A0A8J3DTN2_9RHOB|nr:molybdenum cofactor guanylyltransferase MobA [Agaricicola taiwanensis]GGE44451.1 molybdenum cofactor guanylyltransferase [Agaricicola taiwanensis]